MSRRLKTVLTIICIMILAMCSLTVVFAAGMERELREVPNYDFKKVVHGKGHVIALNAEGILYGWGLNDKGQVTARQISGSVQTNEYITEPVKISQTKYTDIAACDKSSAAIDSNGSVYTWGSSDSYQNGTQVERASGPSQLAGLNNAKSISAGNLHYVVSCAVSSAEPSQGEKIFSWGSNAHKQISNSTDTQIAFNQNSAIVSSKIVPNNTKAVLDNTYYITGSTADSGTSWNGLLLTAIGKSVANNKLSVSLGQRSSVDRIAGIGDGIVAFRSKNNVTFSDWQKYDATSANNQTPLTNYSLSETVDGTTSQTAIAIEDIAIATTADGSYQLLVQNEPGAIYSSGNYGIGKSMTIAAGLAKRISVNNSRKIVSIVGGEDAFISIDDKGRVYIFGDQSDPDVSHKFPKLNEAFTVSQYSDRSYPQAYNFIKGEVVNTSRKRISVYDGTNEDGPNEFSKSVFYFSADELINNANGETGSSSAVDKYAFVEPISPTDTTISLNTSYGQMQVQSSRISETDSADAVSVSYETADTNRKIKISGNKKLVKDKAFTLVIPIYETIGSTVPIQDSNMSIYNELVDVHYVEIVFVFENWSPTAKVPATEFKGDANAIGADKKPVTSDTTAVAFAYKSMTLAASSIVNDIDNNMVSLNAGVNNNPDSIKFTGGITYSADITEDNIQVVFSADKTDIQIIAKKSFIGQAQITLTVEDDFNSRVQVAINVECSAKACGNFEGNISFKAGVQGTTPNVISLATLYSDSGNLIFDDNLYYNSNDITVDKSTDNKTLTVTSMKYTTGPIAITGSIKSPTDPTDRADFVVYVEFSKNIAPSLKSDIRTLEFKNTLETIFSVTDLFVDPENQAIEVDVLSSGVKNIIDVGKRTDGSLRFKPEKQGEDTVQFLIKDGVPGNQVAVNINIKVLNAYMASVVNLTMNSSAVSSGYLASFATGENFSLEDLSAAKFVSTPTDNEMVSFRMSVDSKSITIIPKQMGKKQITVPLDVNGKQVNVELPITVLTFMPTAQVDINVADLKKDGKGTTYSISINQFIESLQVVDFNGVPLNPASFEFVRVNLRGNEKYAVAKVNQERTILDISAIGNTPERTQKLSTTTLEGEEDGGDVGDGEDIVTPEALEIEYIEVVIKEINGTTEYFVAMPITVTGLKLFPTDSEYQLILYISLGVALVIIIILMIISRVKYASNSAKYRKEIEKAKMRDKMKKTQAANQRQSVSIAARASMMGGMAPMPGMGMPNPSMQPQHSVPPPQAPPGASQMPPQPPQQQSADPSFDRVAIEGKGGKKRNSDMPPLKANQKVPKNARDEIDYKIQQKMKEQQQPPQAPPGAQPAPAQPKMSKADKKKQELLEKLRAKMMAGK